MRIDCECQKDVLVQLNRRTRRCGRGRVLTASAGIPFVVEVQWPNDRNNGSHFSDDTQMHNIIMRQTLNSALLREVPVVSR